MFPVIGFALDRDQAETLIRDLGFSIEAAPSEDAAITLLLVCDPNPPMFARQRSSTTNPDEFEEVLADIRKPDNVVSGNLITLAFAGEPNDVIDNLGFHDVGDPDSN